MSTQVNRRRGTTAQHAAFTGAVGETTYDTDLKRLVAHDGALAGGFPAAHLHLAQTFAQTQTFAATENFFGSTATAANKISFLGPAGTGSSTLDFRTNTTPDLNFLRKYSDTPFQIELASSGGIDLVIDSNNNETGTSVRFLTNAIRGGAQTLLFTVQDNGRLVATGALDMGTHLINNVVNPIAAQDAATKSYVDAGLAAGAPPFVDTTNIIKGSADATKLMRFEVDGFTASTTRVLTPPDANITLAGINIAQTFAEDQTFAKRILLPNTTSATVGGIYFGGTRAVHNFGTSNFFAGVGAGNLTMTGTFSTGIGAGALAALTSGDYNTAVGALALDANTSGTLNSAFGVNALTSNTTGNQNNAMGVNSLVANTTGSNNSAVGFGALQSNTTASNNTAVGNQALTFSTGAGNTAIGAAALFANTSGVNNTAIGFTALEGNTTGVSNVGIGLSALQSNTTASRNVAIGDSALITSTTGASNVAIGYNALHNSTTGGFNVAIGETALFSNTTGSFSLAIGYQALGSATGAAANNIGVGYRAGDNITSGVNNIVLGFDIDSPTATNSNTLTIGNLIFGTGVDGTGTTISSGNIGIAVITPTSGLHLGRSFAAPYRATAVTTTFLGSDYTIDCTSGTFTVNLPTAVGITGRIYVAKNSGVGSIILDPAGAELIDGLATATVVSGASLTVQSTGTGWIII